MPGKVLAGALLQVPVTWILAGIDSWIAKYAVPYPDLPMVISGGPFTATAIVIMTGITTALIAAGLAAVRRRALS